jgi:hypothetical protein
MRQAAIDLVKWQLRQKCDAVEAFLTMRLDIVAERLDLEARKPSSTVLISCRQTMSGWLSFSQATRFSMRARTPLMFQVAIFMRLFPLLTRVLSRSGAGNRQNGDRILPCNGVRWKNSCRSRRRRRRSGF